VALNLFADEPWTCEFLKGFMSFLLLDANDSSLLPLIGKGSCESEVATLGWRTLPLRTKLLLLVLHYSIAGNKEVCEMDCLLEFLLGFV